MSKKIIYKLLWSAIEDFVGLWELHWEVNTILKSDSYSNKELIKRVLLYFLDARLINLYYDKWGDNQLQKISQQEAIEIIKGEKFWSAPQMNNVCVKVGSTEKGEKYYNEELIESVVFP